MSQPASRSDRTSSDGKLKNKLKASPKVETSYISTRVGSDGKIEYQREDQARNDHGRVRSDSKIKFRNTEAIAK